MPIWSLVAHQNLQPNLFKNTIKRYFLCPEGTVFFGVCFYTHSIKQPLVRIANLIDREQIASFYKMVDEKVVIAENETVSIATLHSRIVGVVRLVLYPNYSVLRTLCVEPSYEGRGIGSELIKCLLKRIHKGDKVYCLPYPQVEKLYSKFGFERIPPISLPPSLYKRYQKYTQDFEVIAMKIKK